MTQQDKQRNDPLLAPFQIKNLVFRNRVMSTSHACGLHENGMPADRYQAYHEEKARGGIALTMFGGSSNVAADSPSIFEQLNVGEDRIIPHFQKFSERIHAQGSTLMCQITHLGRRGDPWAGEWLPSIGPSHSRETLHRSFAKEMDRHDIDRVVKAYGAAARRCKEGGLDGIETLASSHLIGQFLSPLTNFRTDEFGGSLANRCRFGLMVYEEIRRQVGDDFVVGLRYVVDEGAEGLPFEDCVAAAHLFEQAGTVDFFNAVYGRMDTERALAVDNMPGMDSPIAPWLARVGEFKREVKLPVFHAARISDIATARYAIREGLLDMVAMTRAHIADPHIVEKLMAGKEEQIRPCVGATHCMSAQRPKCIHNAATGRETRLSHRITSDGVAKRRVVVVGGGPAGMEAARVSAERGHDVILFEASGELGGQVRLAARANWRHDLIGMVDWRISELARMGVDVRTNIYAEAEDVIATKPDVVIVATGGMPDLDWIDGAEHCTSVWDVISGGTPITGDVLIYDGTGRHPAPHAAEYCAGLGSTVTLVGLDGVLSAELTYSERSTWKRRCYELGVTVVPDHRLVTVARDGNKLAAHFINEATLTTSIRTADHVVVERGTMPLDEVYQALRSKSANDGVTDIDAMLAGTAQPIRSGDRGFELYRVGDAVTSRNIPSAIYDSLRLCVTL